MSIASIAVEKRTLTNFATIVLLVAGMASYFSLGQLEDPEFTIKSAVVVTSYPGASPAEVELEVTDPIEMAIQQMPQIKKIESNSRAGWSHIKVDIQPQYLSEDLPQVWDELRRKVNDARQQLPPGAEIPQVIDDFGDVYGFLLAVVGDGFSSAELERHVDAIKKELSLVPGVARVELWGVQPECIYLDITQARLAGEGVNIDDIRSTLAHQNAVLQAGAVELQEERLRIETAGAFRSTQDIADLMLRGEMVGQGEEATQLLRIGDIAEVRRGYVEPASAFMLFNGIPCIGVAISNQPGVNIVDLGKALDRRLAKLSNELPVGIEVQRVAWQGDLVRQSIRDFLINLLEAVAIVLAVLWLSMGLRTAFVVGISGLVFVIIITFVFMKLMHIDFQRMSLGALVIAMGMMVDNGIVVVDGVLVRLQQGMDRIKAAVEAATRPSWPLLGATTIAVLAFYPVAASNENAGEYCESLFWVVAISLMLSWVLSVTVTPVMCLAMLKAPAAAGQQKNPYGGRFYRGFRGLLLGAIRARWVVMPIFAALLIVSLVGFKFVNQMFFPASSRAQFMVDYWAPQGTRISDTAAEVDKLEKHARSLSGVDAVTAFIGQGPPRFYLPVEPEKPYSSYGQLIVNVKDFRKVEDLMRQISAWAPQALPDAQVVMRKYGLGPSESWQ